MTAVVTVALMPAWYVCAAGFWLVAAPLLAVKRVAA